MTYTDPVQLFYKEGIAQTIAAEIKENGQRDFSSIYDLAQF